jgi:hypothetical protein
VRSSRDLRVRGAQASGPQDKLPADVLLWRLARGISVMIERGGPRLPPCSTSRAWEVVGISRAARTSPFRDNIPGTFPSSDFGGRQGSGVPASHGIDVDRCGIATRFRCSVAG